MAALDPDRNAEFHEMRLNGDLDTLAAEAEVGNPVAQAEVGRLLCERGRLEEARIWFERAADQSHPPSIVYLIALAAPRGAVVGDPSTAAKLRPRLPPFPEPGAAAYADDLIVSCFDRNDQDPARWFVNAVLEGWLGDSIPVIEAYESGGNSPRNPVEALALTIAHRRALADGSSRVQFGADIMARIEAQLDPPEIEQAQTRAAEWYGIVVR